MSHRHFSHFLRRTGCVTSAAGTLLMLGGGAAWALVTQQLRAEKITVPGNSPLLAGKQVQGPATAYAEALIIKSNAEKGTGGRTFADISEALRTVEKGSEEETLLRGQSASLSTAASLRTSLMTSVLAYGVSALAAGVGLTLAVAGGQLRRSARAAR